MARTALLVRQPRVFHRPIRHGVTFQATHIEVRASQRKTRLRMVKFPRDFPVRGVMAPHAICTQPPLVLVFVASRTRARQAKKCPVEIARRECRPLGRGNPRAIVALGTLYPGVLPVEFESRLRVIEGFRVPANDLEVFSVVFRMAANAVSPRRRRRQHRSVVTAPHRQPRCDLFMTVQAAKLCRARPNLVTRNAARRPIPLTVRFRKRPRADLRRSMCRKDKTPHHQRQSKHEPWHQFPNSSFNCSVSRRRLQSRVSRLSLGRTELYLATRLPNCSCCLRKKTKVRLLRYY